MLKIGFSLAATAGLLLALGGCGTDEERGTVGETLQAKGVEVTLERIDDEVPVPKEDITGLSQPAPGTKLLGARMRVCSDHGGAIGSAAFGIQTSVGAGEVKSPATNYAAAYEIVRDGCGGGWIVFQIDRASEPEEISFEFEDTASAYTNEDRVKASFSWALG